MTPVLVLVAACAPPPPFQPSPELAERAEALSAVEQQVQRVGELPGMGDMLPEVRLTGPRQLGGFETGLGYPYPRGVGAAQAQRDVITGSTAVAHWLDSRRRSHRGETPFHFRTTRVMVCDGAAIQYGVYPVLTAPGVGRGEVTRPFAALWRLEEDGELRLESIWMDPASGATRPGVLATRCRHAAGPREALRYAGRRVGVQLFASLAAEQASGSTRDALVDGGWTQSLNASPERYRLGAQGYYRLTPRWNVTGIASYEPGFSVSGRPSDVAYVATLQGRGLSAAALMVYEVGPLRLGVGPDLTYTSWAWSERLLHKGVEPGEPSSDSSLTPGALLSAGLVWPLWSNLYLDLAGRYRIAGHAAAPGFRDLDGLEASMTAGSVAVGLGWWR